MIPKYYVDTCIWRDFGEQRKDKFRPLGEWAFEFFKKVKESKEIRLYSDLVVRELSLAYSESKIQELFSFILEDQALVKIEIKESQFQEAIRIKKEKQFPYSDLLHAILARDSQAILITRDKHFLELLDLVMIKKPEDLL